MEEYRAIRKPGRSRVEKWLVALCLLAPSVWMIVTIPPLWRDIDAYTQLVQDPLVATFWGHGPAYCYFAKIPVLVGGALERLRSSGSIPQHTDSPQPRLTDTGIWLLIICQHLALGGAAFYFITSISRHFWVRLGLAMLWASNALFYTFAHCVGTESFSMIWLILLVAQAVRLLRDTSEPGWTEWFVFAVALWGAILTRHLNVCLVPLLPAALLLSWALDGRPRLFQLDARTKWARALRNLSLPRLAIATGVALAAFAMTTFTVQGLARKTRFHPHSRVGFTFLWRLRFLETLSPESRDALLKRLASQTHSTEARNLLGLLNQMMAEGMGLHDWAPFMNRALERFYGPQQWEALDRGLNQLSFAFLIPPAPELSQVARADFFAALKTPPTELASYLFDTTAYYFEHKAEMPACANLVTFRNGSIGEIATLPRRHIYFQFWKGISYYGAFALWLTSLVVLVVVSRRNGLATSVTGFAIALTGTGLFMFGATCLLVDDQPRFRLPLWELLLLSLFLVTGKTVDILASRQRPPARR